MNTRKKLLTPLAGKIDQYIDYIRNTINHVFDTERYILYAYDNFCYDQQFSQLQVEENYLKFAELGDISLEQKAKRYRILYNFHEYCRIYDPSLPIIRKRIIITHRKRYKAFIYTEDVMKILLHPEKFTPKISLFQQKRWCCIIGILYCTGLRISELLSLKISDIDFKNCIFTIRGTKFRKNRLVPVHISTIKQIEKYLPLRANQNSDFIFQTIRGKPLAYSGFNTQFIKIISQLQIEQKWNKRMRIHDFRHTFAVNRIVSWQKQGIDVQSHLPFLATYLGHVGIRETSYYLETSEQILQKTLLKFKPL